MSRPLLVIHPETWDRLLDESAAGQIGAVEDVPPGMKESRLGGVRVEQSILIGESVLCVVDAPAQLLEYMKLIARWSINQGRIKKGVRENPLGATSAPGSPKVS